MADDNAPIEITGWACPKARDGGDIVALEKMKFTSAPLGPYDCDVAISHCGICHSDIHLQDGDWGPFSQYGGDGEGQQCGHEGVGTVTKVGASATVAVGDVVAIGWQKGACHDCEWCYDGQENLCAGNTPTCAGGNKGCFADKWRGDSRFAFKVPDEFKGTNEQFVGPLLCGGITVYAPIIKYSKPQSTVGFLGIGGLGHIGVKMAAARGSTVVAISRTDAKKAGTLRMGPEGPDVDSASISYVASSNAEEVKAAENTLDLLIVTITASIDWTPYVSMMRPNGVICFVGAITTPMTLPIFGPLIMKQLSVCGSAIGGRQDIRDMLKFCAAHKSTWPQVEVVPFDQINEACAKVRDCSARFRMVVKN